jgi:O-antigen biosynthesis rhamnosyltransferase
MKILHVYKTFLNDSFGGVEQVIAQIAMNPNASDFQHTVVSLTRHPESFVNRAEHIQNIRFKETFNVASNAVSFDLLMNFGRIVQDYDLIHYHFPWPFADFLHLFWHIKKPTVLTYHSDIVRQKRMLFFYKPLMHLFLRKMTRIVATSPNYVSTSDVLRQYVSKVSVIPIGLNKEKYPTSDERQVQEWQERFGPRFFLFMGVMRYYKGLHILLDALKGSTFPVVLVGTGPTLPELKSRAQRLGLKHVHFLGQVSEEDKVALLRACGAVVFPSHLRSEAFGVSLLEGAMFGKALISSEIGTGTSYINQNGKTGLVVPPNDPQALHEAMSFIWHNPAHAAMMGKEAEARYWELFTGQQMISQYEALYREILHR